MGYCTEPPKGVCSRAFVEKGSHNTNFDGVCFYPKWSLPGYAAIFRWGVSGFSVSVSFLEPAWSAARAVTDSHAMASQSAAAVAAANGTRVACVHLMCSHHHFRPYGHIVKPHVGPASKNPNTKAQLEVAARSLTCRPLLPVTAHPPALPCSAPSGSCAPCLPLQPPQ